jgi:hypothetical protein
LNFPALRDSKHKKDAPVGASFHFHIVSPV